MIKGTQRQIAWATDISKKYIKATKLFKETFNDPGSQFKPEDAEKVFPMIDKAILKIENSEAGKIIDIHFDIDKIWNANADMEHDAKHLGTGKVYHVPAMVFDIKNFQMAVARATALINNF